MIGSNLVRILTLGHESKNQIAEAYLPLYIVGTNGYLKNHKIGAQMEDKEVGREDRLYNGHFSVVRTGPLQGVYGQNSGDPRTRMGKKTTP